MLVERMTLRCAAGFDGAVLLGGREIAVERRDAAGRAPRERFAGAGGAADFRCAGEKYENVAGFA